MGKITAGKIQTITNFAILLIALIGLYLTSLFNYLLFHTLAEGFSIVVAVSFFVIAWNCKKYTDNSYLVFLGIAYLFISLIDLLHTLSYKGMPIFTDYDYYANQLWIAARYMESITLLIAFIFFSKDKTFNENIVFTIYAILTGLIFASIFYWKIFPPCFVEGKGLTPFKKISEYIICLILVATIFLLRQNKPKFESKIYLLMLGAIITTIISELAFTFYISNYGFSNLVGHYFKIFSFLFIYDAIIKTGIENPFDLIFLDLDRANKQLNQEIDIRAKAEYEKEKLIHKLQRALEEIKTLKGILPFCSFCKKIRDDEGYWEKVDVYIHKHSQADISHSICPECAQKYYAEFLKNPDSIEK